jgi:hypothetical protein
MFHWPDVRRGPRRRAASFAARGTARSVSQLERWRERPRCARFQWPRACPEGSLTPSLPVTVSMSVRASFASAPTLTARVNVTVIVTHFIRTICFCSCRDLNQRGALVPPDCAADCCVCAGRDVVPLPCPLRDNEHDSDRCADHHAFDARSVLVTVQGSSLRAARACARPAGLDGACAQIRSWQSLMVGEVMMRSWADLGLIFTVDRDSAALISPHRPCSLHTLRERNHPRGALTAGALRATTDSPLPD